jgi:hypothetical protein
VKEGKKRGERSAEVVVQNEIREKKGIAKRKGIATRLANIDKCEASEARI